MTDILFKNLPNQKYDMMQATPHEQQRGFSLEKIQIILNERKKNK